VNKVIGNIHLSPGRSFQTNRQNIYELVPYLRDDGNKHDFSHIVHHLAFETDDEYDYWKAASGQKMKKKLGLEKNPMDGIEARVRRAMVTINSRVY
jgi:hypothetical protein